MEKGVCFMFRPLAKQNKQISDEACVEILTQETRGILAVSGDGGYPYAMPMNHFYCQEDGCIYFHCGRYGHRLDAIRRCDKVSFCVCESGRLEEGDWGLYVRSVIVFGRMEVVDDPMLIAPIMTALSHKFTQDEAYIQEEIARFGKATLLLKLSPEHICGKAVQEK